MKVNGMTVQVTRNLRDALLAITSRPELSHLPVWADALCINQKDVAERNREVTRMIDIYRNALRVVIWTGNVDPEWDFFGLKPSYFIPVANNKLFMHREDERNIPGQYTDDEILGFIMLMTHPYWARGWIFQELYAAKEDNIVLL